MKNLILTLVLLISGFGYSQTNMWTDFNVYPDVNIEHLPYIGIDTNSSLRIYDTKTFAELIIIYINEERRINGLPPLVKDEELMKFAQKHSDWMTKTNKYQHSGENIDEVINKGGGYYGKSLALNAQICVRAWMFSPGHRKHLLNPNFTRIGSGFNQNKVEGYITAVFKR